MSLLWVDAARRDWGDDRPQDARQGNSWAEEHSEHSLHPTFESAGIRHAPCAYSLCDDFDPDYSKAFDAAERRLFDINDHGAPEPPVERLDLSTPVHGFESLADLHTLRRYERDPAARGSHPVVFRHGGEHFILNGHHGIAAAMRRGDSHINAHVIDLDDRD